MRCNAMRRSLRKYEHFGMIDDTRGGGEEEEKRVRHERQHDIHVCVRVCASVHAQVPLPLTT